MILSWIWIENIEFLVFLGFFSAKSIGEVCVHSEVLTVVVIALGY